MAMLIVIALITMMTMTVGAVDFIIAASAGTTMMMIAGVAEVAVVAGMTTMIDPDR